MISTYSADHHALTLAVSQGLDLHTYSHAWIILKFSITLRTNRFLFSLIMHECLLLPLYSSWNENSRFPLRVTQHTGTVSPYSCLPEKPSDTLSLVFVQWLPFCSYCIIAKQWSSMFGMWYHLLSDHCHWLGNSKSLI